MPNDVNKTLSPKDVNDFINIVQSSTEPVKIQVKISANAKKNSIETEGDKIKLKISKPAVDGKANKEIISFLSNILNLPKNNIKILSGEKSSFKMLLITPKTLQ